MNLTHRQSHFCVFIQGLRQYTPAQLILLLRNRQVPLLLRCAALRWLIYWAPVEVTKGQPYLARRRRVREHYRV